MIEVLIALIGVGAACSPTIGAGTTTASDDAGTPAGLVAWWRLDETMGRVVHDSVGASNGEFTTTDGSLVWEPTGGKIGGALSFAGNAAFVTLGTPPALMNMPALTLGAWLEPTNTTFDGVSACFFDHGQPTGGWTFNSEYAADGDLAFTAEFANGKLSRTSVPGVLVVGTWTHVAVTWDGSGSSNGVHLYANGVELASADAHDGTGGRLDDTALGAAIGCIADVGFAGLVDDVELYDRVLDPLEIATL